jgi:hypothetical protein
MAMGFLFPSHVVLVSGMIRNGLPWTEKRRLFFSVAAFAEYLFRFFICSPADISTHFSIRTLTTTTKEENRSFTRHSSHETWVPVSSLVRDLLEVRKCIDQSSSYFIADRHE